MKNRIDATAVLPSGQSFDFWETEQIYPELFTA